MKLDKFNEYITAATIAPGLKITMVGTAPALFPYFDIVGKAASLAVAFISRVSEAPAGGTDPLEYTVVASMHLKDGAEEYSIWCGDTFIEARRLSEDDARKRCTEAIGSLPRRNQLISEMMGVYNKFKESDRCDFWVGWRRDKKLCAHTSALLAHLRDNVPDFTDTLKTAYEAATGNAPAGIPVGETMGLEELAFRVPVMYEGERGGGKTFEARAFCRKNNYTRVEVGGNQGIEAPDMLGFLVPFGPGAMVWKDGPLAEAWRKAKTQKVVLLIDELLRIPEKELSILLTALTPDEGVYRLRTGRIVSVEDGVGQEEELECPVENLCVIGTTNVGSQYAVDDIDEALAERFVPIRKDSDAASLKLILTSVAGARKLPKTIVKECIDFFVKMTEARKRGLVHRTPTTRTLVRAMELASSADDVRRAIKSQVLLWVARDSEGHPVEEQMTDVTKLIDRCFGA